MSVYLGLTGISSNTYLTMKHLLKEIKSMVLGHTMA